MTSDLYTYKFKTENGYGKMFSDGLKYDKLSREYDIINVYKVEIEKGKLKHIDITKEIIND